MNKIFKVIWSKSKQCYIVVSEIAKNKTGKKKIVVASILATLALTSNVVTVHGAMPDGSRTDTLGVAIGTGSASNSNQSVAIGYASSAQAPSSSPENPATAVGAGAKANGTGAVALGLSSNATGANAVAIGGGSNGGTNKTEATAANATAVGFNAKASGLDSIAMGSRSAAKQHSSVSIGLEAASDGVRSVAIGPKASATDEDSIAIGTGGFGADKNNQAVGNNGGSVTQTLNGISGVQLYYGAKSTGKQSIAMGYIANAKDSGIAIGNYAVSDSGGGTAMGKSVISRSGGIVVGQSSNAIGQNSVAYGNTVNATNVNSVALGNRSTASDQNAVAVGYNNTASGQESVAIGNGNQASNKGAVSVGASNSVTANTAVAIGRVSNASGLLSTAIGNGAISKGTYDVAIGSDVTANGNNSVAIGRNAKTSNASSLAIGVYGSKGTSATGDYSIAMGRDVTASAESAIAIGKDAVADKKNAVAFGSGSDTSSSATAQSSTTIGGKTYSWNKGVLSGADLAGMQVSVGKIGFERQIKNVAAGEISANSTDAINGAQLYSVASGLAKDLKTPYVSIKSGITGTGSNVDNDGATGANSIAIGPSSAVTNQNSVALGNNAQSLSDDSIVIGRNAKAESGSVFTNTSRAIAIGSNSRVATNVVQGIAIGSGTKADEGAVVTGDQSIAIGGNVKVDGHGAVGIGGDDAQKAGSMSVTYTNTNNAEVTGTLRSAILNLTGYDLSKFKGTTAGHAGVAYGTSALAGNAGVAIGTASDSMTRKDDKGQIVDNNPVTNAVAIGTGARANFDNSVAIGGGSNTDHYATKQVNAIIDGVEVKWTGGENIAPGDVVSFGAKGFERQLKNVAPGEVSATSTDAINGSQIYSLARKVTNIMNGGSGSVVNVNAAGEPLSKVVTGTGASKVEKYYRTVDVNDDGTLVNGAVAQTPTALALVNVDQTNVNQQTQTPRTLGNVANGVKDNDAVNVAQLNAAKVKYFSVNSTEAGNKNNDGATGTDAIAIGPSAVSNAVGSVALGKDAKANGDFTVALGGGNWQFKGAQANGVGTTALGSNTKTQANTNYQTAIGFGATTGAESALALGYNASATAQNAIALGKSASTAGQDAVALGSSSQAKGDSGLAIGNGAQANSNSVISLGYQANNGASNNTYGVAIGWAAGMQSNGLNNVGVGTNAGRQVIGNNNTSLGNGAGNIANTKIYTSESIMLGTGAKVVGSSATKSIDNVIAIGKNASGSASSAIAVGINAGSSAENGVAIGPNSNTSAYNGIALGSFSEASTVAGVSGYNVNANRTDKYKGLTDIALTSKLGAVSVGNSTMTRQITGVAAGTNDTDAVNIAQLKSVNLAFTGNTGSGDVNLANSKLSINGDNTYIKTAANGKELTISPNIQNITLNNGRASASTGLADASNVAQAINNVVSGVQLDIVANKGTKTGSVNLSNQKLTVTGGNGIRTDLYASTGGQSGQTLVIGLEPALVNATSKGISLTGENGSTGNKYLKDGDVSFAVKGDGNLVSTSATATGVKVTVDTAKVKDLAVEAVTVSKANNISDNPITVTPTTGTNSKDYAIGIDTTKLAAKTNLAYTANGATAKTVSLAKGLNFVNGTNTVATVDSDGKVAFDLNQATKDSINKSATAVGRTITLNADSGTGSSQSLSNGNVSFAVSGATGDYISTTMDGSAVKVSTKRAIIDSDANTGKASVTGADGLATAKNVANAINSAVNGLSQNLNISDGTKNSSVALKNQKLTVTGTGAAKATVSGQTITIDVAKGTLTANADGTATGTAGVADASDVVSAINNTNTVLGDKIATNTTNIAHTIALADDKGTSTTAKSLKDGNVSFNIKGDGKFISTAASGNDVKLTVNEQAIKDAAKAASSFKVKANAHAEEEVKGGDTITFNNGDNIEISQTGKTFTIKTAKDMTVDSVTAGNTVINTSGLTNGTTAITGTGITTDKVTVGGISIDKTNGINAGGKVISNVASGGTTDTNAANIGDVKQAIANLSQNLNITDGTNNGSVDLKNQKLNVAGANGVTATVNNQTITVGLDANTVNATTKGIGLTADTGSTGNKYLKDGDVSFVVTGDGNLVNTSATAAGVKVAVDTAKVKDLAVDAVTVSKDAQADNPITVTPTAGTNSKDYAIGIDTTKLAAKTDVTYRANSATDANAKKVSLSKGFNFVDGGSTVATVDEDGKVSFDLNTATKTQINANTANIATNAGKIATNEANITKNTTNIATNTAALARNISLGADSGTTSSQSLSKADVAFNVKGATGDFVSTNMNGNTVEISTTRATINSNATTGEASVTGNDGLATAQNVADAINKAADAAKAGAAWNITTNSSTTDKTAVKGGDTVDLVNGDNIEITQDGTDKKKITVATKKDITVDSVTANNKVTVGSGANKITLDGTDGSVTGKAFTGTTFTGTSFTGTSFTAGNTVINTNGLTNGTTAITGTGVTTDNVTVGGISIDKTAGINAGNKVISNVASGGTTATNAANIGDVQNAVANLSQNLNITDGTHDGTVDLKNQKLNVAGANGVTATVNNQTITVGLDADTVNATTKGIGLTADTGSTGNKYLKDGDVSFAVTGDGSLVSTSATAAGVKVAVNSATITAGTDGTITGPTTDGVATAKNVADAINAAKKASKTEITANTGEAANATTGNVTLTSTTAADGHTIYDVKLNDKVTLGTGANAVTVDGTTGAITGKTANIGGVTVNGTANTIGGLSNTTWNGTATTGRAATEDQLKAVADAAGSQTWEITADKDAATSGAQTGTKKNAKVGKDDKVQLIAGENLTVNQNERDFTYSLNKDLVKMNSATFEATGGKTTVIKGDSIVQTDGTNVNTSNATSNTITDGTNTSTITAGKAQIGTVGIDGVASKISTGGTNAVVVNGADGTIKTGNVTVTGGTTNDITGLSNTTLTATDFATKGRAATEEQLKAATGATTLKFTGDVATNTGSVNLKDDTFGIKGDGKYISTDVNGKNVNLTVSEAEVKKSAVAAVTVSTDTTDANNPLTVTPTTSADGTTKDYKVTIDGTKIANKTNLSYKANGGTAKQVSLADGLNFKNGTLTTASIDDAGVVKYDVNTASITASADGTITGPTTDGVATAKNVADAINAAKKASKTEITANTGEAANATTGNVTLTSTTAADGHTIYDVKLNDKVTLGSGANAVTIDGTAGKATIGSSVINGVNNTFTTGGAKAVTLDGATGTITGTTANIGGVAVNGTANTIGGLSNTTWNGTATTGRAATEDQLKAVADAAGSQTWEITADKKAGTSGAQTGTKENAKVGKDDKVSLIAGENLTVDQAGKNFTYSLNKDLLKMNSATFEVTGGKTTVIKGDSIVQTDGNQTNTATASGNTVANGTKSTETTADGQVIKDGAKSNKSTVDNNVIDDGNGNVNTSNATSNTITDGTNTSTIAAGKAQIGTVGIDGVASKITTGGANAVKLDGVAGTIKTGTVTVTGGTTNDITGLSNTTLSATDFATKGRAATEEQLKAATGATTLKFTGDVATNTGSVNLKDDTFGIKGDGKYISTDVNGKNVNLTVSEAEVKKSAVAAVTVSTDTTDANNPLTVTPTTSADGTTKDYKVTIDGTKIANKTNLSYKANGGTAKQVSLADGLNFKNGTLTTASIDDAGVVKYDVNTASITASADGTITGPTTDGVATAKNVADAINAAKKASKTEITANTGEAANATTGNVTLTSTTAADGHTIYDVKLNDKVTLGSGANAVTIDGTAGKATIGSSIVDGVNSTFTTGGANAVKLDGAAGTIKTGTVTVTGGTTNDITGLSNTTVTSADFATKGRAATEEQLKAVGEQTWQITADKDATTSGAQTGTKKDAKVGKNDKVQLIAGENMTVNQNERDFTFTLNKDLVKMNSTTFVGTGSNTTVITGNSITQTAGTQTNTSTAGGNTVADGTKSTETTAAGQVIKDGAKSNKSTVSSNVIDDGNGNVNTSNATFNTITDGTNTSAITAGKATIGSSVVDGVNNTFTTGGANAVKLDGVAGIIKTGTVTVTGGTTNDITGLSNTTVTAADFATKGRAATEEQLKAVGEQTWQITADKDATTSGVQTGTKKDAKVGKDDKVQLIAGENLTVNQNERDFTYSLNKDLVKMNSATFEATGGKTTVIKGDSIVQTDGTKVNTSTAAGNTVVDGAKSTATTADGTTVTTANGNTNYAADGVRINTTGKTPVSLTDAGLDNGNNVIKNVASGHVNNDATDNTNAANIADVKKATTTVTANAGEAANATTGNVTLTSTTAADGHTIYDVKLNDKVTLGSGANAVTIDGTAGKATFGSSVVDGVNNTFTTGGANAVKLDGAAGTIKTGTVTVTGGTTNDITGLSNTTVTAADFATKGRAATEEQLKAVGEQTWQITADKDATTSGAQTGTKKDAKVGKNDKVQLIAGENMTVNQNERDFTFTLNKDLVKMNSATFEATGGKTTVIKGDSIVQTDGTKVNTSTAGGNTVADGTKSTETTADGQVIKDGTKTNTSTVDENTLVDGAKSNKATVDSNVVDDGNGNVNTSNATSNTITDGTNRSTITAGKATIGSSVIDGVNNTFTTGGANAVKLDGAAGTVKTGTVTVTGGTTNDITGLSNTTVTAADFATKGRAATEEQLKAVGEQTWQITADKDATTSGTQTGTKKDAKVGKDDKVQLIAGENMTVNQNERDFTFTLNKDLVKMNSATFLGTGTNKTVITGDSITQTAGTQTNTSTAGGNTVADGTKSTETTAAGQVIKNGAKSNKSTVDNNVIDDGTGNVNTSNATSNTITDGTNTTATRSSSVTVKDNAGNSTVITKDNITTGVGGNKITLDGTAGKATVGASVVDGVNNTFITGGANAVKLDGVAGTIKTGTVTVTGGTTNDITGLSNTTVTAADFATKGRAATEEQLKAVGEQTWQITADKDATTSGAQTGTKKDAKVGKDDKVQLIAGENITVTQNERDFTFTLNKDLVKMNSATFLGTGTNTTVITGDSITQTAGTQMNTSTAGGNTVADGTKSTETTAAGQVIKDGAKSNKSTVDNNVIDDGNGNVNTSNATSNTITDGTNTTATTSSSVTVKDNAGNSTVITKDNITTGVGGNKITLDGTAGKATIGSSVVDGVNNTFTTGGANAVKLDGVAGTIKTGTVTVTGGTTNDITGLSNTTVTAADFATKGRAATEEQLKAVGEQTWQITADKDATTSGAQTGTKKDAKVGKDNKVQLIAGENMTINQNERDFTFTLNKDLVKMNSATFLGTGSNTTVITGNSITQTAGTQTNTSTAGGNTVADGTKSTETTAAGQVIKDGAKSNKSTVDSNVIDDGNGNKNTSNATSNTITDGTNTSTITAGKANIGNIAVDGVNNKITMGTGANPVTLDGANGHLDGLTNTTWVPGVTKATTGRAATEDQLQQVSDAVGAGWKVNTGTVAGSSGVSNGAASTKVSSGEEVKLQAGDNLVIDQNGKTVSYSLNKDLTKMNSATFEATGGKTTVIKGDSIVQTDGGKTNTSNAAGNTVVDGNKSTATTAAGTTITDGAKTNTSTADKNVINDGAGNTNVSNATSNTLKNAAGDETKSDAKGVTVKDAAGNNATFTKDGITITKSGKDTVSLTSNGLDNGKNKIVNVAAGVANTDAVNVGQLKEYAAKSTTELTANGGQPAGSTTGNIVLTKTTAADGHTIYDNKLNDKITLGTDPTKAVTVDGTTGTVTGLTNKTWTPGSIVSGRAATEDQLKEAVADSGWKAAVDKEGSGQSTVVGTSPEKIKAEETVTFKAGNNMMVTQTGKSISYAVNPELTDMKSATFKDAAGNTTVTNGNGITITPGSANPTNPHAGPVSLTKDGLNNGNNQIKGVAPGTDPTDAVNVSQLNASNANTSQAINQIAGEVQHVGAHAAAMAALKPIQYDPLEPTQVMAGVGNYRGETAAALGLAHYTNENTMFNVGVSVGGNHNMVNAGVTHKFGYSPEKKNIPDRYKAGPISSVYVMQDEVSSLKKENAEQKYVIADQAARLTTLEAENEQQRRELAETKKGLDDLKAAVDKLLASKG